MAQVDIDIKSVLTIGCVCIFVVAVSSFHLGGGETLQPLIFLINKIKYYLNSYTFLSYDSVFVFYPSAIKG